MKSSKAKEKYLAFLRGINVGGHHKVPMAELQKMMEKLKFENVVTLLNSGNIVFDAAAASPKSLEQIIARQLEKDFGFPVPTILRKAEVIEKLLENDPFKNIEVTKDTRFYVSFLKDEIEVELSLPWVSDDGSFLIVDKQNKTIVSVLDLSITRTPKGMEALEKLFGKDITTRNWNTIKRIEKKLHS